MEMLKALALLSDEEAKKRARIVFEVLKDSVKGLVTEPSPALRTIIENLGVDTGGTTSLADEATLARHVLVFLAETKPNEVAQALRAAVTESLLEGTALIIVGLVALQTKYRIKKTSTGKWTFEIGKEALSDALMRDFLKLMMRLWEPQPSASPKSSSSPRASDKETQQPKPKRAHAQRKASSNPAPKKSKKGK